MSKWVDRYGRSKPKGIRRVYNGKKSHNGRPLPFHLQVRPQKAEPTTHVIRGCGKPMPWFGYYLEYKSCLNNYSLIPILMKPYSGECQWDLVDSKGEVIFKVQTECPLRAFGLCKALGEFLKDDITLEPIEDGK